MERILLLCIFVFIGAFAADNIVVQSKNINFNNAASDFRWISNDIAFIISNDSPRVLWRTADGGLSWLSQAAQMNALLPSGVHAQPEFIYHHSSEAKKVYVRGNETHAWFSHDAGETWQLFPTEAGYRGLQWHPTKVDWALASISRSDDYTLINDLYFTQNYGETWTLVSHDVERYSWGDAGTGIVPENRVFFTHFVAGRPSFVQTDDWGKTLRVIQEDAIDFLFLKKQIFILVIEKTSQEVRLKVSPSIGFDFRDFHDAEFPFGDDLPLNSFTILDDETGAVYLGINHRSVFSRWGNIYLSNSLGNQYALSQAHVSHLYGVYDFHNMNGIDGIYLTNINTLWEEQSAVALTSSITRDNGDNWRPLTPPHFDSNNQTIVCSGCTLNVHGWTGYLQSAVGPLYSTEKAVGLLLANGNVGRSLEDQTNEINTYLSRDAGLTWKELRKGPSTYEYGDHGSIIVIAPLDVATSTIYYTLDEGTTPLRSLPLPQSLPPIQVINIVTEPSSTNNKFILQGKLDNGQGILIGLDFSHVYNRTCAKEDYEHWTPSGEVEGLCLLGRKVVYSRRSPSAMCFSATEKEPIVSSTPCACTEDDWECDFKHERNDKNECVPLPGYTPEFPPKNCPPGFEYNQTTGYRPVAGTYCQGGVQRWGKGPFKCPDPAKKSYGWVAAVVLVPIFIAIAFVAFGCFAMRNETLREKLPFLKSLAGTPIGYFGLRNTGGDEDDNDIFEREDDEESIIPTKPLNDDEEDSFDPRA